MKKHCFRKSRYDCAAAVLLILVCAAAAAAAGYIENVWKQAVETAAGVILPMAEDGAVYFRAVDSVRDYLSEEIGLEQALDALDSARNALDEKAGETSGAAELPEGTARALERAGIDVQEFREFAGARDYKLSEYVWSLDSLREYLEAVSGEAVSGEAVSGEAVSEEAVSEETVSGENGSEEGSPQEAGSEEDSLEMAFGEDLSMIRSLDILRETYWGILYYAGVNRWFARWDEKRTEYVREQILDRFPPDFSPGYPWETELSVVERKTAIFKKYREMYYELPMGYLSEDSGKYDRLRAKYEEETDSVFPKGSWMFSLLNVKMVRESEREARKVSEKNDEYQKRYFEESSGFDEKN